MGSGHGQKNLGPWILLVSEKTENTADTKVEMVKEEPVEFILDAFDEGRKVPWLVNAESSACSILVRMPSEDDWGEIILFTALCFPLCQ